MLKQTRKGTYSEYFANYIFSVLGFTTAVARQEDYGVDFFCSLNHDKKLQTFVGDAYAVQVKSSYSEVTYGITSTGKASKEQIDFLFDLKIPFFIAIVDLNNQSLNLYSTTPYRFVKKENPQCSAITFKFDKSIGDAEIHNDYSSKKLVNVSNIQGDGKKYIINLKKPIVSILSKDIHNEALINRIREILRVYVRLEQKNIVFDELRWPHFHWPYKFTTNDSNIVFKWIHYNEEPHISNPDIMLAYNGEFIKALAFAFKLHGKTEEYDAMRIIAKTLPEFHKDMPTDDFKELFDS